MRLTFVRWSLPLVLVSMMAFAQQSTPAAQKLPQEAVAKSSAAQSDHARIAKATTTHHRAAAREKAASSRISSKRPAYRREYTQNSVEVMNGASTQKVVFHTDEPATGLGKDKAPAPMTVEVVNGTSTDTQYFSPAQGAAQQNLAEPKQPVVVAIQSSDTRVVGGNKHPVVTGITAVQPGDAKSASGGGPKLATGVAPRPKRPAYQPDAH